MDNITQGVIGGSLYTLITGKRSNKQFLLGALITNIPDFDIIIGRLLPLSPMDEMFFHRGIMHSVIFNVALAFALAYFLYRSDRSVAYWRYVLGIFASIVFGHLLIDGMTSYGMRYRLPRDDTVRSRDNMFVIDFGMWMITIGGILWYMVSRAKQKIATGILTVVGAYIAFSVVVQSYVTTIFQADYPTELSGDTITSTRTLVEPLQPFLWRHLIQTPKGYYAGYYSVFDQSRDISWKRSSTDQTGAELIATLMSSSTDTELSRHLRQVTNFSRGHYRVVPIASGYSIQNMVFGPLLGRQSGDQQRMFSFDLVSLGTGYAVTAHNERGGLSLNGTLRHDFWQRVWGNK